MKTSARASRALVRFASDLLWAEAAEPFTGYVERRDPSTYQRASVHLTWRCVNQYCRQWTMNGAHLTGCCNFCQTAREPTAST